MAIRNVSVVHSDEKALIKRKAIEDRATWMGRIYEEGVKDGVDMETIIRRAINATGLAKGATVKGNCKDSTNCIEFCQAFLGNPVSRTTFQMEFETCTEDELKVNFHYCPLVEAWQKIGYDEATCAKLCDMAMDGDRAIAEGAGLKLDIPEKISEGGSCCRLHFHKVDK